MPLLKKVKQLLILELNQMPRAVTGFDEDELLAHETIVIKDNMVMNG